MSTSSTSGDALERAVWLLLFAVLSTLILRELSTLLQPLLLAIFLCYASWPLRDLLLRLRVPKQVVIVVIPGVVLVGLTLFVFLVTSSLDVLTERLPFYRERAEFLLGEAEQLTAHLHPKLQEGIGQISIPWNQVGSLAAGGLGSILGGIGTFFVVIFYVVFLVLEMNSFPRRFQSAFGEKKWRDVQKILNRIGQRTADYVRVKALISLLATLPCALMLFLFGVDLWFFWSVLIFFGNFVPYLGALVAFIPPVILCFLETGSFLGALVLASLLAGAKNLIEAVVEPQLAGKALNLSPLVLVLAVTFGAWLWGVIGMVLSVPILMTLQTILEAIPSTRAIASLLGDQAEPASS